MTCPRAIGVLTTVVLLAQLGGCAVGVEKLPTCEGHHRRPANPYGSVLAGPSPSPAGLAGPAGGPASPPEPAKGLPMSGLDRRSLAPCQGARP